MAQRDGILKGVDEAMQAFLKKQSQEALQNEEAMEKAADAELVRLLKKMCIRDSPWIASSAILVPLRF